MSDSIDKLGLNLSDLIERYGIEVKNEALELLDKTADKILDYIKKNVPKGQSYHHLVDSFVKTPSGDGAKKVIYISSKSKGRLVHLIELGFKHKSGRHVAARPFLRPAYDSFTPEMLEEIKNIINGGSI
ncbi:MAG: hypothetical protein K2N64_05190 [Anaeroplasmataceae bacterium]|nr:hypothetical protein [Anaeroplasmataceae bacterium]